MAEYDRIGQHAFLAKYGFGKAYRFLLKDHKKRYDSKAILGVGGILAQVCCEVNYDFIDPDPRGVERAKHVQMRAPREIFGLEKTAHVRAEIPAASGY